MNRRFEDMCIMIVFDTPGMAHKVRETLRRFGFDWFILSNFGEDPLTTFKMNKIDLVVLAVENNPKFAHRFTSFLRDNVSQGGATVPVAYVTHEPIESVEAICRELAINIVARAPLNALSFLTSLKTSLRMKASSALSTNYIPAERQITSPIEPQWDRSIFSQRA